MHDHHFLLVVNKPASVHPRFVCNQHADHLFDECLPVLPNGCHQHGL